MAMSGGASVVANLGWQPFVQAPTKVGVYQSMVIGTGSITTRAR